MKICQWHYRFGAKNSSNQKVLHPQTLISHLVSEDSTHRNIIISKISIESRSISPSQGMWFSYGVKTSRHPQYVPCALRLLGQAFHHTLSFAAIELECSKTTTSILTKVYSTLRDNKREQRDQEGTHDILIGIHLIFSIHSAKISPFQGNSSVSKSNLWMYSDFQD